jgi:hypothetical protein
MKRRLSYLRRGDIAAIAIALILVAFSLFAFVKFPNGLRPTGWGPEWNCTSGGSLCMKKPSANSSNKTAP